LYESPEPISDLGAPGSFDDSGVNPSCIVKNGDEKYLYYIGWQRCKRVPYMLFAGPAVNKGDNRFGFGRPRVIKEADKYSMWYSIRSRTEPYKIGYAESSDEISRIRKDDEAGIERSQTGWDSEMICCPCVVDANGKRFMFYNGNRHGSTGFGCAVSES